MPGHGAMSPPETLNVRIRPPDIPSVDYRAGSRAPELPSPNEYGNRPGPPEIPSPSGYRTGCRPPDVTSPPEFRTGCRSSDITSPPDYRAGARAQDLPSPPAYRHSSRAPEIPSPPSYRPSSRAALGIQIPEPIQLSSRPLQNEDEEEEHEPLRISFHEDDIRSQSLSRPGSCKSGHDECILPPGPFERPGTATLERDIDDDDPYPSLQHVRTSASGLLRFPDDGPDGEETEQQRTLPCAPLQERDTLSQCRLLPSPYPYWADDEDLQSPQQKDPFMGYVASLYLSLRVPYEKFHFLCFSFFRHSETSIKNIMRKNKN